MRREGFHNGRMPRMPRTRTCSGPVPGRGGAGGGEAAPRGERLPVPPGLCGVGPAAVKAVM